MSTALTRDAFMPTAPKGMGASLVLALGAHLILIIALAFSVNWHASEPAPIEAELWAAVPQIAAPRTVEPPPPAPTPVLKPIRPAPKIESPPPRPVPDAQISIEKARKEKKLLEQKKEQEEKEKAEKEKAKLRDQAKRQQQEKQEADRKKKAEEAQKTAQIEAQREAQLKRILGQAGASNEPAGTATQSAGPSASYAGRITAIIKRNSVFAGSVEGNPAAEVEVRAGPDGTILNRTLIKSSGDSEWDEAVLRAIDKTAVLPRDVDGRVPSPIVIAFRPRDF